MTGRLANLKVRRLVRFGATGLAGFAADFGTLVATHSGFGWPLRPSLALAYTIGGCVHYGLTRWWVFPPAAPGSEGARVMRYLALAAVNAGVTVVTVPALTDAGIDYRLAKVLCVAALFGFNYLATPRLVMRSAPPRPPHPEA